MIKLNIFIVILSALTITACGQFSSSSGASSSLIPLERKPYGTCDRKTVATINLCMEAVGIDYDEAGYLGILKSSCESSGGVFSTENCDPASSFGVCIVGAGQSNVTYVTYYPPQFTTVTAQSACEGAGGVYVSR